MFARDSCISTGVLWMWHSDSDYVHFCPLAFGRRSFNHFWSSESDPMSAVGLAIVSLFLLLFSTLLGWTVDWVRNVDDASLKYCDRSLVRAPAAAVHAICQKCQMIPFTQSTAQPSTQSVVACKGRKEGLMIGFAKRERA